jgi:endonuclease/exonuclease/phosphatase (EEP) superfamily protein YafD
MKSVLLSTISCNFELLLEACPSIHCRQQVGGNHLNLQLMIQKILSHPIFHLLFSAMVLLGVMVSVFPRFLPCLPWGSQYAIHLMLFYLATGMFMLVARQPRLTFVSFAGSLLLSFFLKYAMNDKGIDYLRQTVIRSKSSITSISWAPITKLAHVNLSNVNSPEELMELTRSSQADILSLQEVTPGWTSWLADSMKIIYPHAHVMQDLGIFGMAIFSKYKIEAVDTVFFEEIPTLKVGLNIGGYDMSLVSVHTEPALNEYSLGRLRQHLSAVEDLLRECEDPALVFGDFNAVNWSEEIRSFIQETDLMSSRSGFMTSGFPPNVPLNHIFYSRHFTCIGFNVLRSPASISRQLGIAGIYKFNANQQQ